MVSLMGRWQARRMRHIATGRASDGQLQAPKARRPKTMTEVIVIPRLLAAPMFLLLLLPLLLDVTCARQLEPASRAKAGGHEQSPNDTSSETPQGGRGHKDWLQPHQHHHQDMPGMVASLMPDRAGSGGAPVHGSSLDWRLALDERGRYQLEWQPHYEANRIQFELILSTGSELLHRGGLFALGFSADGQLESTSDFCLAWFDLARRVHLQDARPRIQTPEGASKGQLELVEPSLSACKLISSSPAEAGSSSRSIRIERPLDVCDSLHYQIDNGTTHLVWFALAGQLLSIDSLSLPELARRAASRPMTAAPGPSMVSSELELGMRRVQLVGRPQRATARPVSRSMRPQQPLAGAGLDGSPEAAGPRSLGPNRYNATSLEQTAHEGGIQRRYTQPSKAGGGGHSGVAEFKMQKLQVGAKDTTYWCKMFKLSRKFANRRYHITRYQASIEPANEQFVHHMELFNCALGSGQQQSGQLLQQQLDQLWSTRQPNRDGQDDLGWQGECADPRKPAPLNSCKRVIVAWALGAAPLEYPAQVGQPVGGPDYSQYVMLEVHYNNLAGRQFTDSSGLQFEYTRHLRAHDAGVLEVGLKYGPEMSLPPGLVAPLAGFCSAECLRASLREPIHVFAGQLHTHLTGVSSWTELIREGRRVAELQRDNHYSPHFQDIRLLPEPVRVEPGDSLAHYCLYDTRRRTNVTLGGYATSDEMCVTYLHYYPKVDLEVCKSTVDRRTLSAYFGYLARNEGQPLLSLPRKPDQSGAHGSGAGGLDNTVAAEPTSTLLGPAAGEASVEGLVDDKSIISHNYRAIEWTQRRSVELMELYANAPLDVECLAGNGKPLPGTWTGVGQPGPDVAGQLDGELGGEPQQSAAFGGPLGAGAAASPTIAYRGRAAGSRHAQCGPVRPRPRLSGGSGGAQRREWSAPS